MCRPGRQGWKCVWVWCHRKRTPVSMQGLKCQGLAVNEQLFKYLNDQSGALGRLIWHSL